MTVNHWEFLESDQRLLPALWDTLPEKVFDIHAHIYRLDCLGEQAELYVKGPAEASVEVWHEHVGRIVGDSRLVGGLLVPPPPSSDAYIEAANRYVISQLAEHPDSKGLVLISPHMQKGLLEEYLANTQIVGFKPFSTFADYSPVWQAPLASYLPEWAWEIADERGYMMLVHLVRDKALNDPENYQEITRMCEKYPRAKLLLDHAARGFHAPNTQEGVKRVAGLENIWFDISCICEPLPMIAILQTFGCKRLVWGSDFPLSQFRGKAVTVGNGFFWLGSSNVDWDSYADMCMPTLIGIESLRAAKDAFEILGLGKGEAESIFYRNAVQLTNPLLLGSDLGE